jgi:hypothetical protein
MSSEQSQSSSDSDEDMPLSSLNKGKKKKISVVEDEEESDQEAEFESEDDEEEEYNEDADDGEEEGDDDNNDDDRYDDDDDDDDSYDEPISKLKSPSKKRTRTNTSTTSTKAKTAKKAKTTPTKKTAKKKITSTAKKSSPKKKKSNISYDNDFLASAALYANSKKGKLISELLRRWWYVITWPEPSCIPKIIPKRCDMLNGFPGVYVTTSGDDVGKIIDYRNHDECPNFKNIAKKDSKELKELLLSAIDKQREVLIENEGKGTVVEKDLKKLEKWAKGVNVKEAEKEAEKVLKAKGLTLD